MANRPAERSVLRYPLDRILGNLTHVRVLRELLVSGQSLTPSELARRTGVSRQGVRAAVAMLETLQIVKGSGAASGRACWINREHALAAPLEGLFTAESNRHRRFLDAIAGIGASPGLSVRGVWLYGSVSRGEDTPSSDIDVAVIVPDSAPQNAYSIVRSIVDKSFERIADVPSVVVLRPSEIAELKRSNDPWWTAVKNEAVVLFGDSPEIVEQNPSTKSHRAGRVPA